MWFDVTKVDTWVAPLEDRPGALAEKLEHLSKAGVDLDFIVARRAPDRPGEGVVFLTPIHPGAQAAVAVRLGFRVAESMRVLRLEGPDEPGVAFLILRELTEEKINLRGLSAARMQGRFVIYLAVDSDLEADRAIEALKHAN